MYFRGSLSTFEPISLLIFKVKYLLFPASRAIRAEFAETFEKKSLSVEKSPALTSNDLTCLFHLQNLQ